MAEQHTTNQQADMRYLLSEQQKGTTREEKEEENQEPDKPFIAVAQDRATD